MVPNENSETSENSETLDKNFFPSFPSFPRFPSFRKRYLNLSGDEKHAIFDCTKVDGTNIDMASELSDVWKMDGVFDLLHSLKDAGFLD